MGRRRPKAMSVDDAEDPTTTPLTRIRLSATQERLLRATVEAGDAGHDHDGRQFAAADTLIDWGFATGGNRSAREGRGPYVKATTRGQRWLQRYGRRA